MADIKKLKAAVDLAQLNHNSFQNDETRAAVEAAQQAYDLAVEADEDQDDLVTDAELAAAQAKLDKMKADKLAGKKVTKPGPLSKASTTGQVGAGSVGSEPVVKPAQQPVVVPSATNPAVEVVTSKGVVTDTDATGGAGQGEPSDATKAAQEVAAEKKSE